MKFCNRATQPNAKPMATPAFAVNRDGKADSTYVVIPVASFCPPVTSQ
jgi:hypothetical protein